MGASSVCAVSGNGGQLFYAGFSATDHSGRSPGLLPQFGRNHDGPSRQRRHTSLGGLSPSQFELNNNYPTHPFSPSVFSKQAHCCVCFPRASLDNPSQSSANASNPTQT